MRKLLSRLLEESMLADDKIYLLTGDLGFGVITEIRDRMPDRVINVGSSEQLMLGAAVGMAHNNLIPICYSITPFLIFRPYEFIRNYLNHEQTAVKLLGMGRGKDYGHLGFSHWADDDVDALNVFDKIVKFRPCSDSELESVWQNFLYNNQPSYINVKR